MHYTVLYGLIVVYSVLVNARAIGIDGKLDFGNSRSPSSSFRSHSTGHRNTFVPINTKVEKAGDDFDNIGVVCVSGGCNTTKSTNNTGNIIQTDILVHVQTKVDLNESKTGPVEDTPDVPVVVGYRGSKLDPTVDEESNRSLDPQSIYVPDLGPKPSYPTYDGESDTAYYGSSFGSSLPPTINTKVDSSSSTLDRFNPSVTYQYNPSGNSHSTPTIHSRVDSNRRQFYPSFSSKGGSLYGSTDPKVNINLQPSSVDTKTNTIEIKVPYFEPAYHNHYYGENPPPQLVWYPKKSHGYNPVEFKTVKSTWTPSAWNRKIAPHHHVSTLGSGVQCSCKEGERTPDLRWTPSTNRGGFNDPGSQINDKLAPLNE